MMDHLEWVYNELLEKAWVMLKFKTRLSETHQENAGDVITNCPVSSAFGLDKGEVRTRQARQRSGLLVT